MNTEAHHGLVVARAPCSLGSLIFILISSLNLWHGQFTAFWDVPTQSFLPQSPSPAWCLRRGPVAALGVGVQGSGAAAERNEAGRTRGSFPASPCKQTGRRNRFGGWQGTEKGNVCPVCITAPRHRRSQEAALQWVLASPGRGALHTPQTRGGCRGSGALPPRTAPGADTHRPCRRGKPRTPSNFK